MFILICESLKGAIKRRGNKYENMLIYLITFDLCLMFDIDNGCIHMRILIEHYIYYQKEQY